jgi:hypothetical protein
MDQKPIPTYYVLQETTAGPLYFWPMPAVRQAHLSHWEHRSATWTDDDGNPAEVRNGYVITRTLTSQLVMSWPESPTVSHYERKPETDMSPVARTLAAADPAAYPLTITKADWEGRCEYGPDSGCNDCTWHKIRDGLYRRVMTDPAIRSHEFDVSGLEQLDITRPDPNPELEWKLDSPSLAAFYPRPAWHQFPGYLAGPLDEVATEARKRLAELGADVSSFFVFDSDRRISVTVSIPWDVPMPWEKVKGRSQKVHELNRSRQLAATQAMRWHAEVVVPRTVRGETKVDAMAAAGRLINDLVAKLVPPHTVACEKCKGYGYVR